MNHIVFTRESAVAIRNELKEVQCSDVFVLVDNNSRNYCLNSLNLGAVPVEHIITIAEGEHNKSLESVSYIWQVLSEQHCNIFILSSS